MAAGWSPELFFTLPTSSQEFSDAARARAGHCPGRDGAQDLRRSLRPEPWKESYCPRPAQRKDNSVEFKTLSILKIKPQQSGSLKGLRHSAEIENGSCDWTEASREDQGRAWDGVGGDLGGQHPHADHLLSPCFPGSPLHPTVLSFHI